MIKLVLLFQFPPFRQGTNIGANYNIRPLTMNNKQHREVVKISLASYITLTSTDDLQPPTDHVGQFLLPVKIH